LKTPNNNKNKREKRTAWPFPNSKRHLAANVNTTRDINASRKTLFYTGERNKRSVTKTPSKNITNGHFSYYLIKIDLGGGHLGMCLLFLSNN
jgi:hypothetical protein